MVSLAGLQIFDALILYVTGDNRIPIKCAVGRLNFNHGTVTFDRTLLDTQKSVLHVQGQASLINQAVKAEIDADAKQFDLLDLHGAVVVQGKLRQPQISLGRVFPIPTPVIGTAKDVGLRAGDAAVVPRSVANAHAAPCCSLRTLSCRLLALCVIATHGTKAPKPAALRPTPACPVVLFSTRTAPVPSTQQQYQTLSQTEELCRGRERVEQRSFPTATHAPSIHQRELIERVEHHIRDGRTRPRPAITSRCRPAALRQLGAAPGRAGAVLRPCRSSGPTYGANTGDYNAVQEAFPAMRLLLANQLGVFVLRRRPDRLGHLHRCRVRAVLRSRVDRRLRRHAEQ